jgi:hypothetical protein
MMGGRRSASLVLYAALGVGAALPSEAAAQFGGRVDLHSGPVAWDQADGRDQLLNGEIGAGFRLRPLLGLVPELLGGFALSTGPDTRTAVRWDMGARLHTTGSTGGIWLGAALGAAGTETPANQLTRLEGGLRRSLGRAHVNVWISRTGFGGRIVSGGGLGQDSASSPDTLVRKGISEYTDVGSRVSLSLSRYELGLALTRRLGTELGRRSGWELSGTWWLAPSLGVVGATGHSLPQFGMHLPGGRFGTVGVRFAFGGRSILTGTPRSPVGSRTVAPTLVVSRRRLTIQWAPARQAEVIGDFTDWKAQALSPIGGGRWTLPAELSPGVHHLNVRFDRGAWLVPAGAFAVDDGFGGRVGLIVVR